MNGQTRRALAIVAAIASICLLAIGSALTPGSFVFRLDHAISEHLHEGCPPALLAFLRTLSFFGNGEVLLVFTVLGFVLLLARGRRRDAAIFTIALAGGGLLNGALKLAYARARPVWEHPLATAHGFGFPSGHAMGAFLLAGMIAYLVTRQTEDTRARAAIVAGAVLWTSAMGLSRVVLGVHFPSDVLAGYAASAAWLAVCLAALSKPRPERQEGRASVK